MSKLKLNQLNDFVDPNQENDIQQNTVNNPDEQPDIDNDTVNENVNPEDIENQNDNENDTSEKDFIKYKDSTHDLVSKIGYLFGIPKKVFESDSLPQKLSIYNELDANKNARIIRNLCMLRTCIERGFKYINNAMRYDHRSILNMPEYIPSEIITQLNEDGIAFYKKTSIRLTHHIIEINKLIADRINNCKSIFPLWINWDYIKELFIMPDGTTEIGTKAATDVYYNNLNLYPYKIYFNWRKPEPEGNILYNDKKFTTLLYKWHGKEFTEYSKVSDAGKYVKDTIYDFIENGEKVVVIVDCENSDPYKLSSVFRNLDYKYTQKIATIILVDDVHTASAWRILEQFTSIPVEHVMTERVKDSKSLVDTILVARVCKEHYKNDVDSFIIVSSDSDYWGLIDSLKDDVAFLVMVERANCGPDLKNALVEAGIFYCYIDDFYSANTEDVKHVSLMRAMMNYIEDSIRLNVNEMFDNALRETRIEMTRSERNQFFAKYVKTIKMHIDDDGNVVFEFNAIH